MRRFSLPDRKNGEAAAGADDRMRRMTNRDARVDAYIQKAQPFARLILTHKALVALVKKARIAFDGLSKTRNWKYER